MESLIIKITNKYTCFYSLLKVRGAWNKGQLLKGGVVEKRLKTAGLKTTVWSVVTAHTFFGVQHLRWTVLI